MNSPLNKLHKAAEISLLKKQLMYYIFFQPISLGIFRSDYMIDKSGGLLDNGYIKQVEMNTIALGSIAFASLVYNMHR